MNGLDQIAFTSWISVTRDERPETRDQIPDLVSSSDKAAEEGPWSLSRFNCQLGSCWCGNPPPKRTWKPSPVLHQPTLLLFPLRACRSLSLSSLFSSNSLFTLGQGATKASEQSLFLCSNPPSNRRTAEFDSKYRFTRRTINRSQPEQRALLF
jgi:hypothetical protein